jgi:hypothetical protein
MDNNTRAPKYVYLRNEKCFPVACMAYRYDRSTGHFVYGLSVHNPLDKFERATSRKIALGRLEKDPMKFSAPCNFPLPQALSLVITEISNNTRSPKRLQKAAKQYLNHKKSLTECTQTI